jgi:hypothetical protein
MCLRSQRNERDVMLEMFYLRCLVTQDITLDAV